MSGPNDPGFHRLIAFVFRRHAALDGSPLALNRADHKQLLIQKAAKTPGDVPVAG